MKDVRLSEAELTELVEILQIASWDADTAIKQSHDMEEVQALRELKQKIQRWIKRFRAAGGE